MNRKHLIAGLGLTLALAWPMAQAGVLEDAQRAQRAGDFAAALTTLDKGLASTPRDADLRFLRGVVLADLGRDAEALATFQRLSEDFPELSDPHNNLAVLHAAAGRLQSARQALEQALRNDPAHQAARENLGDVYLRLALATWQDVPLPRRDAALVRKLRLAREVLRLPESAASAP